jgi:hypothetical protein
MDGEKSKIDALHLWVFPPNTPVPLVKSPLRFAVGTPEGVSSNSWRAWVQGMETYVSCRDNFREFKVSLHSSGVWRVAFTEEAFKKNSHLHSLDGDRVLHRHKPDLTDKTKAVIGFQIVILQRGLYLNPEQRKKWPKSVVFAEPPLSESEMTVVSIVVVPGDDNLVFPEGVRGAVIGKLPLGSDQTVQLVVTHESDTTIKPIIGEGYKKSLNNQPAGIPEEAVFLAHGNRLEGTPWIAALRISDAKSIGEQTEKNV